MTFIRICLIMKNRKTGEEKKNTAMIRDNLCITRFGDPKQAAQTFAALKQQGADVSFTRGVIIEKYTKKSAAEIADKMEKDITAVKTQLRNQMQIKHTRSKIL